MGPRSAGRATHAAEFESFHALIDARHRLTVLINGALMTRTPRNDAFASGTAQIHPPIAHDFMASAHGGRLGVRWPRKRSNRLTTVTGKLRRQGRNCWVWVCSDAPPSLARTNKEKGGGRLELIRRSRPLSHAGRAKRSQAPQSRPASLPMSRIRGPRAGKSR
jgi:hypothetical protein